MWCERSGYIALDADPHRMDDEALALLAKLQAEWPTSMQRTPTGGIHFLYMLPRAGPALTNSSGALPVGFDVRVAGYILLTPSVCIYHGDEARAKGVEDGFVGDYAWLDGFKPYEFPPQPLPDFILDLLRTKPARKTGAPPPQAREGVSTGSLNGNYAKAALSGELDLLAKTPVGQRNEQLNKSTFALSQLVAGGELDESEVVQKLSDVATAIGLDEREIARTIASGIKAGAKSPRSVPEIPVLVFPRRTEIHENGNSEDSMPGPSSLPDPEGAEHPLGASSKIQSALKTMGHGFQLNLLREQVELADGTPLHDGQQATIIAQLFERGMKNKALMQDVILADAWANRYDPLVDALNALEWDGEDHISQLSYFFDDLHPVIEYEDGIKRTVFSVWLRKWLIGAIARGLESPVQNPMLVLAAEQGIGKSEFAKWLCSPFPEYFVESAIDTENIDHQRLATGNFVWEVGELGATTRKADVEALKAFITRHEHSYRVPYAKNIVNKKARASFIGTVNPDNAGFLTDTTGNRRFLTVNLTAINWPGYTAKIEARQVWAQARAIYLAEPDSWQLSEIERVTRDRINADFNTEDPVRDALLSIFEIQKGAEPGEANFISNRDLVFGVGSEVRSQSTRSLQMDIARALKGLGATKGRVNSIRGYWGVTKK